MKKLLGFIDEDVSLKKMISNKYRINKDYLVVKAAFADIQGELVQAMLPSGWGIDKHKGFRRRAVLKIYVGSKLYKFKVAMYSSTKNKYYLHIVNTDDAPFRIKFLSSRLTVEDKHSHTEITETLEYTTKNKSLDTFLSLFINIYYFIKRFKYKLYFFRNG